MNCHKKVNKSYLFYLLKIIIIIKITEKKIKLLLAVNRTTKMQFFFFFRFESETHPGQVDYFDFCNMVEEAFVTLGLEKTPSTYPREFLATYEIAK